MVDPLASNSAAPGHADHDPELIVALLDRDLASEDRAVAEARLVACPACAALHEDLMAVATANVELATPSRPRDFILTPDVAAALARERAREPVPAPTRLTGEMTVPRSMHVAHDRLVIANFVDRSPSDTERARAEEQLAACPDCALLYDDLISLSAATRAMLVPLRPRDFALTRADAERLRVRGWRRLLAAIGSSRDMFSRPLAIGLTTLGLAGLLVATIPGSFLSVGGAATSLPAADDAARNAAGDAGTGPGANPESQAQGSAAPSAAAESGPETAATVPSAAPPVAAAPAPAASAIDSPPEALVEGGESSPIAGEPDGRGAVDLYSKSLTVTEPMGPSPMVVVAALLLLSGLGLFGLRWTARRFRDG